MSYLLANGCSYTDYNFGKNRDDNYNNAKEREELGIPDDNWKMWPEYVAERLDLDHLNLGKSGGSNQRIYQTSLGQISKEKPEVLMHLWTSDDRYRVLNRDASIYSFIKALSVAICLMRLDTTIFNSDFSPPWDRGSGQLAYKLISIYYPEDLNTIIDFYSRLFIDKRPQMKRFLDIIKPGTDKIGTSAFKSHHLDKMQLQTQLLRFWTHYFWKDAYKSDEEINRQNDEIISLELGHILSTIYMCKYENIKFVGCFGLQWSSYFHHLPEALNKYSGILQDAIKIDTPSKGPDNNFWKRFSLYENPKNLNVFEIILLSVNYSGGRNFRNFIRNKLFDKIDTLILNNETVAIGWPPVKDYNPNAGLKKFLKGYCPISFQDGHPDPGTQKLIGDVFYDAYQKNYS